MRVDRSRGRSGASVAPHRRRATDSASPMRRLLDEELAAAGIPMHGPSVRTLAQTRRGSHAARRARRSPTTVSVARLVLRLDERGADAFRRRAGERGATGRARRCGQAWCAGLTSGPTVSGERRRRRRSGAACSLSTSHGSSRSAASTTRASWADWADWARGFLSKMLGSPAARRRWPESELAAYDAVERVVEGLRSLVEVEPGSDQLGQVVRAHLAAMLDDACRPPGLFGHGVLCGPLAPRRRRRPRRRSSCSAWPRVTSRRRASRARCSPPQNETRSRRRSRQPRGRGTNAARTSLLSRRRRGGGCSRHGRRAAKSRTQRRGSSTRHATHAVTSTRSTRARRARPGRQRRCTSATSASCVDWRPQPLADASARRVANPSSPVASPRSRLGSSDAFSEWEGDVGEHAELAIADTLAVGDLACRHGRAARLGTSSTTCSHVREQDDVAEVDELEARHRGTLVHEILERLGKRAPRALPGQGRPDAAAASRHGSRGRSTAREVVEQVTDEVLDEFERLGAAPYPILWAVEQASGSCAT